MVTKLDTSVAIQLLSQQKDYELDLSDVRGQEMAKQAMTIAAAGGHIVLVFVKPVDGILCALFASGTGPRVYRFEW